MNMCVCACSKNCSHLNGWGSVTKYISLNLNFLYKWQEEPWGHMYIISKIAKMLGTAEVILTN